jgi:hypothetical protein
LTCDSKHTYKKKFGLRFGNKSATCNFVRKNLKIDSVITTTSGGSTTDDDIVWVEEDIGDNCVRVRYVKEGGKINTGTLKQQLKHREHFI